MTNDLKTTISGILGVAAWFAGKYGFDVPPFVSDSIAGVLLSIFAYYTNKGENK